jgi:hypothetical protein
VDLSEIKNAVAQFKEGKKSVSSKKQVLASLKGLVSKSELSSMTVHQALEFFTMVLELPDVVALTDGGETFTLGELTRTERGPRQPKVALAPSVEDDHGEDDEDEDDESDEDVA